MSQLELFATLEKLEQVQIVNSNRIDADDQLFCESQEKAYRDTVALFVSITEQLKSAKSSFIQRYKDIGHFEDRLPEIKEEHVYGICRYFENKYKVTLNKERIHSKYKKQDVTVDMVLDEIFVELGGFNFNEKSANEIKAEMRRIASYRGGVFGGKVKGNRVTLEHSFVVSHCSIFHRYSLGDNSIALFKALSHFELGLSEEHEQFIAFYGRHYDRTGDHIFDKLDLSLDKVKSIKFFKNGRIDIDFNSGTAALAFAKEYCGYVEAAKSA